MTLVSLFRGKFSKKDTYHFGPRSITFVYKVLSKKESFKIKIAGKVREYFGMYAIEQIKKELFKFKDDYLLQEIMSLEVRIVKRDEYIYQMAMWMDDIRQIIYVNLYYLDKTNINQVFIHELAHLLNFNLSQVQLWKKKYHEISKKKIIKSVKKDSSKDLATHIYNIRFWFQNFFIRVINEGVADYYLYLRNNEIIFGEEYFDQLYDVAKDEAYIVNDGVVNNFKNWNINISINRLQQDINCSIGKSFYKIGPHIIFTLVYSGLNYFELIKKKPFQLIRIYENYMVKNHMQPVISFGNDRGIISYKRLLSLLKEVYEKKKNHR
jgi:hypothetical protein